MGYHLLHEQYLSVDWADAPKDRQKKDSIIIGRMLLFIVKIVIFNSLLANSFAAVLAP